MTEQKKPKTKLIQVVTGKEDYDSWVDEAQKDGRTLANWVRYVLHLYMKGGER